MYCIGDLVSFSALNVSYLILPFFVSLYFWNVLWTLLCVCVHFFLFPTAVRNLDANTSARQSCAKKKEIRKISLAVQHSLNQFRGHFEPGHRESPLPIRERREACLEMSTSGFNKGGAKKQTNPPTCVQSKLRASSHCQKKQI